MATPNWLFRLFGLNTVRFNGEDISPRSNNIDFREDATVADYDPTTDAIVVPVGGSGSGHSIAKGELYADLATTRAKLAFDYAGLGAVWTDDAPNNTTVIPLPGRADFGSLGPFGLGLVPIAPETGNKVLASTDGVVDWGDAAGLAAGTVTGAPFTWSGAAWSEGQFITLGLSGTPAGDGLIRIPHGGELVYGRNFADNADIVIIRWGAETNDALELGANVALSITYEVGTGKQHLFRVAGANKATLTGSAFTLDGTVTPTFSVFTAGIAHFNGSGTLSSSLVSLTADVTGLLPFANIANGSALSVFGVTGGSPGVMASIVGTANQVLRVNSAGTALAFGAINAQSSAAIVPDFGSQAGITTSTWTANELRALQDSADVNPAEITGRKAGGGGTLTPDGASIVYFQAERCTGSSTFVEAGGVRFVYDFADPENSANRIVWTEVRSYDSQGVATVSRTGQLQVAINDDAAVQVMSFAIANGEQVELDIDVVLSLDSGDVSDRVKRTWSGTYINDGGGVGDTAQWGTDVDKFPLTAAGALATGYTLTVEVVPTDTYLQLMVGVVLIGEPDTAAPSTAFVTAAVSRLNLGAG